MSKLIEEIYFHREFKCEQAHNIPMVRAPCAGGSSWQMHARRIDSNH